MMSGTDIFAEDDERGASNNGVEGQNRTAYQQQQQQQQQQQNTEEKNYLLDIDDEPLVSTYTRSKSRHQRSASAQHHHRQNENESAASRFQQSAASFDSDDDDNKSDYDDDNDSAASMTTFSNAAASIAAQTLSSINLGIIHTLSHWKVLVFGQVLSLLLASTGAASATLHFECNLSAPTFQSLFLYAALGLHFLVFVGKQRGWCYSFGSRRCCRRTNAVVSEPAGNKTTRRVRIDFDFDLSEHQQRENFSDDKVGRGMLTRGIDDSPIHTLFWGKVTIHAPAWIYFLMAFLNVEANYLIFLAFRYTTFTSITLFDSLAIPSAMMYSRALLGRRYKCVHLFGAIICMVGVIVNVLSDYESDMDEEEEEALMDITGSTTSSSDNYDVQFPHKVMGDFLAIAGGIVYGLNDVLAEMAVRDFGGQEEYLSMLGLFGTIISVVQVTILERDQVRQFFQRDEDDSNVNSSDGRTCSRSAGLALVFGYVVANYISYVGVSRFLRLSESALLNLSLLTGDLYAVMFSVLAEGIVPHHLFWVALTLIVSGVFVYEIGPSPIVMDHKPTNIKFRTKRRAVVQDNDDDLIWGTDLDSVEMMEPYRDIPAIT